MAFPEDPDALLAEVAAWPREALEALHDGLGRILATPAPADSTAAIVPRVPGLTLRHEYVQCGKAGCTRCPHGPYWYAYWREGSRLRSGYIGKVSPEQAVYAQTAGVR